MFEFIKSQEGIVAKIVKHLGCSAMVDLLLKIVSSEDITYDMRILHVSFP